MNVEIELEATYEPSDDIVAREIEGEIIIIPLVAGIGDLEDELYTLNDSAKAIWDRLDGRATVREVATALADEYEVEAAIILQDVVGLLEELVGRKMVVKVGAAG